MPGVAGIPEGTDGGTPRIVGPSRRTRLRGRCLPGWRCLWIAVGLLSLLLWPGTLRAVEVTRAQQDNGRCYNCHGQQRIATLSVEERQSMVAPPQDPDELKQEPEHRPGLLVTPDTLADGPHAALACTDCHQDAKELPHNFNLDLRHINCTSACHQPAAAAYRRGIHAEAAAKGDQQAPTCVDCHGGHNIYPASDKRSRTYPLNVVNLCGDCHREHHDEATHKYVENYMESVHGKAVVEGGVIVAATCADCHGSHDIRPAQDADSTVNRAHVPDTCGQCHEGVEDVYNQSIHGKHLSEGDPNAPVCTDCHAAHSITQANTPGFLRDIVSECGQCHDKLSKKNGKGLSLYETYRMSYHGQVNQLGFSRAAKCSDCHGAHNILPASDPLSRINPNNLVSTCRECHKEANANFTKFMPHADYHDWKNYPLLAGVWTYFIVLMSITFGFFGLHSLLWLIRSLIERHKHPAAHVEQDKNDKHYAIKRFRRINRINHAFVVISFFGLTLTGMPLLYSDQEWAKGLAAAVGGANAAGIWHRFFAVILVVNFIVHFYGVFQRFRKQSPKALLTGTYTLLPRWRDVTDCLGMFRWFFTGKKQPAFDRWTYFEKFDYWAEIAGTFIIGGTGLMLWFPDIFSAVIPGWSFNIATIVHGYEALLAAGFIFTIHFFNANLRPEKFPVDDVIFTGVVNEEELKHERPTEYEQLVKSGQLESMRVPVPPKWTRTVSIIVGVTAMSIGLALVVLIVLAGLHVL